METTISWETDRPANSFVEFGLSGQYDKGHAVDDALVQTHRIKIYGLERDKDYHFRVRAVDIFGREAVSKDLVFNTKSVGSWADIEEQPTENNDLHIKKSRFFWVNSKLALYFETTKSSKLTVKYVKTMELPEDKHGQKFSSSKKCSAKLRADNRKLVIEACYKCHSSETLGISHPVGLEVKGALTVHKELPLLHGRIITCVTCHNPHGSSLPYFAHKDLERDTCITCHKEY